MERKHRVCMYLPPFAGDYSGVCSALFDLGGMICIHDAAGCTGNYTHFDEPRWYGSDSMVYCTGLRKVDAILGDDEKVIRKIVKNANGKKPRFIAIVGSPVPNVIGFDFNGVARSVENRTGIPSFGFATAGIKGNYMTGIVLAFETLSRYYDRNPIKKDKWDEKKDIAIPGISPLDMHGRVFESLCSKLRSHNIDIMNEDGRYGNILLYQHPSKIRLNLAWNQAGLEISREMKRKYGTPYIKGFPIGDAAFEEYVGMIRRGKTDELRAEPPAEPKRHASVFADAVIGSSIRNILLENDIDAKIFTIESECDGAVFLKDEDEILKAVKEEDDILIADPLLLEYSDSAKTRIALPHYAISSRIGIKDNFDYTDAQAWIQLL